MSDTDSFLQEVSEELRRDKLYRNIRKYGWVAILLVILIVGAATYREYLKSQINRFGGNISKTAAFVEMERSALHRKLKSLGINSGQKN